MQRDVEGVRREQIADALAHELDDGVEVELLGERGTDLVDDRELGGPLVGLGQEALRLVEEARVLERHAHARRERGEEPLVGVAEGVRLRRARC